MPLRRCRGGLWHPTCPPASGQAGHPPALLRSSKGRRGARAGTAGDTPLVAAGLVAPGRRAAIGRRSAFVSGALGASKQGEGARGSGLHAAWGSAGSSTEQERAPSPAARISISTLHPRPHPGASREGRGNSLEALDALGALQNGPFAGNLLSARAVHPRGRRAVWREARPVQAGLGRLGAPGASSRPDREPPNAGAPVQAPGRRQDAEKTFRRPSTATIRPRTRLCRLPAPPGPLDAVARPQQPGGGRPRPSPAFNTAWQPNRRGVGGGSRLQPACVKLQTALDAGSRAAGCRQQQETQQQELQHPDQSL